MQPLRDACRACGAPLDALHPGRCSTCPDPPERDFEPRHPDAFRPPDLHNVAKLIAEIFPDRGALKRAWDELEALRKAELLAWRNDEAGHAELLLGPAGGSRLVAHCAKNAYDLLAQAALFEAEHQGILRRVCAAAQRARDERSAK